MTRRSTSHTYEGDFPHEAALGYRDQLGVLWMCGGALISDQYVITAAHCINNNGYSYTFISNGHLPSISILTASCDLSSTTPNTVSIGAFRIKSLQPEQTFDIENVIVHPNYTVGLLYDDVALIKLSRPIDLSQTQRPACLWLEHSVKVKRPIVTSYGIGEFHFLSLRLLIH